MHDAALVTAFGERWRGLGGFYYRALDRTELIGSLQEAWGVLVDSVPGSHTVVAWMPPELKNYDLGNILAPLGAGMVVRWAPTADMRQVSAQAVLGITGAAWAVAETGTVALYSTPETGLLASVLPPAHLMLVRADTIVATVAEGLRQVAGQPLPPLMKLITGPSMTADIEGTLVTGVHGPGKVGVVVYDRSMGT